MIKATVDKTEFTTIREYPVLVEDKGDGQLFLQLSEQAGVALTVAASLSCQVKVGSYYNDAYYFTNKTRPFKGSVTLHNKE